MRALILVLLLTGCASTREVARVVPVDPSMTEQVPEPQLQGDTNAALVDWIERWKAALAEANRRLAAIGAIKP